MPRNWLPLTASVLPAANEPAATFTMRRSAPVAPTDTVSAASATEPLPSATLFAAVTLALVPKAIASTPAAATLALRPMAMPPVAPAATRAPPVSSVAELPMASEWSAAAWL